MRLPLCVILELLLKYIKITQSYARNLPSAYAKERLSYINKNLLILGRKFSGKEEFEDEHIRWQPFV